MNIKIELEKEELSDNITALKAYNFTLSQFSKDRRLSAKERKNAEEDIKIIEKLITKLEKNLKKGVVKNGI